MSKCPLQIYLNEKYFDSCASVQPSTRLNNDAVKNREYYVPKFQQKTEQKNAHNDSCEARSNFGNYCFTNNTVFNDYLTQHCKSIEAYRNLQKQQEEVLELCKQKIAKRFPSRLSTQLNDEDIIKALRLAENSKCHLLENEKSNELIHAILKVIISSENQKLCLENSIPNNDSLCQKEEKSFRTEISVSEYFNTKRKSMFGKFMGLFTKPNNSHRSYYTSSDNYFNNKYTLNTSTVGIVRYPGEPKDACPVRDCKKKAFKQLLNKLAGDSWRTLSKSAKSETSADTSITASTINGKQNVNTYLTYYCEYKRDVDILKNAVRKQQEEIQSIQKNLNQCLEILRRVEEKSERHDNFLKKDAQTYHVLTNHYRGFQNPAEPYGRHYRQYRAEGDISYPPQRCNSGYTEITPQSNSSNDKAQQKCCGCCFKKSKKKKKKKDRKKKDMTEIHRDVHSKVSIHRGEGYEEEKDVKTVKETVITTHVKSPPIIEPLPQIDTLDDSDFVTLQSGETGDSNVQPIGIDPEPEVTITDSEPEDSEDKKKCANCEKKKKKKAKKRKPKERKRKKKSKKKKESQVMSTPDGTPRKRPCFIRFCKFLFCSSCCA